MSTHDDAAPTSPAEPSASTAPTAPTAPSATTAPSAPSTPNNVDHLSTQLVVLGAGGSGIAAALAAAERGVEVILLEKGNKPGGAAMFGATGFAAYGSPAQREAGETFGPREAYRAITAYTRHRCNAPLVSAVVGRSGDTAAWLEGHGLRTQLVEHGEAAQDPTVTAPAPHDDADPLTTHRAARTYHRYVSKFGGFKKLLKAFEGFGGRLLTETAATALLTGPDGNKLTGETFVDDHQLFSGVGAGVEIVPLRAAPGLQAARIGGLRRKWVKGRAAQTGAVSARLMRDGILERKLLKRSTFYRDAHDWLLVR